MGVIAAGLVGGLPAGALYSIPGRYLRPENRAVGMGIFLTWLYIGIAVLPMAAGWLAAVTGSDHHGPVQRAHGPGERRVPGRPGPRREPP